jgi:hypothetical protein
MEGGEELPCDYEVVQLYQKLAGQILFRRGEGKETEK